MEKSVQERLEDLEVLAAHQAQTIEDLNDVVVDQGKTIGDLRRKLDMLAKRFVELEDQLEGQVPVDKPPHW